MRGHLYYTSGHNPRVALLPQGGFCSTRVSHECIHANVYTRFMEVLLRERVFRLVYEWTRSPRGVSRPTSVCVSSTPTGDSRKE